MTMRDVKVDGVTYQGARITFGTNVIEKPFSVWDPPRFAEHIAATRWCEVSIPGVQMSGPVTVEAEGHGTARGQARRTTDGTSIALSEPFADGGPR